MKSIHELLTDPDNLAKLSNDELKKLFEPYIPDTRKALLPVEKPSKLGLDRRVMEKVLSDPRILADLARYKQTKGIK